MTSGTRYQLKVSIFDVAEIPKVEVQFFVGPGLG